MRGRTVTFGVVGSPVPQGSVVGHVTKRRDGSSFASIHYATGTKLHAWRHAIGRAARAEWGDELEYGPVQIQLVFTMRRPLAQYRGLGHEVRERFRDARPDNSPDLDKLVRAVLDSLTDIVYADDGQVVQIVAEKVYGVSPGLSVTVGNA